MLVKLYAGQIQGGPTDDVALDAKSLDRVAILVYEGTFNSMDGEVTITRDHLTGLASQHNKQHAMKLAGGEVPMRECPPIQLDHSTSARDTIGRLVGPLHTDTVEIEGKMVTALLGTVRFLGADNVEKARDGRYTNVSIGADLTTNTLKELSVVPFPAAAKASLLAQGADEMDKEKLKKHLMRSTKCSDKEADEKLAGMDEDEQKKLAAESDEYDKKMAADEDEDKKDLADGDGDEDDKKDKKDKKDDDAKMAAAKEKGVKLSGIITETKKLLAEQRVQLARGDVNNRLVKLRAAGKLTPAEQKVMLAKGKDKASFVERLAAAPEIARELVFEQMEAREPVIAAGQLGTIKAVDLSQGGESLRKQRSARLMEESLSNMAFTKKALGAADANGNVKLSEQDPEPIEPANDAKNEPEIKVIDDDTLAAMKANEARLSSMLGQLEAAL